MAICQRWCRQASDRAGAWLEIVVLADLVAAGAIADDAERQAVKAAAFEVLRQRCLARPTAARPHEPEPPVVPSPSPSPRPVSTTRTTAPSEPERPLNRHRRRALAATARRAALHARALADLEPAAAPATAGRRA